MNIAPAPARRLPRAAAPDASVHPVRLGLLTPHDITDRRAFSGTAWYAARALANEPGIALTVLGGHARKRRFLSGIGRSSPTPCPTPGDLEGLDVILGLTATGLLDALPANAPPVLHVTDATPGFLERDYGWPVTAHAHAAEARVAARASVCIYSSAEMAMRARTELGPLPARRFRAVPFGTNACDPPASPPGKTDRGPLRLLFVGSNWDRKGGEMALDILSHLRGAGQDARLTVVGPCPRRVRRIKGVEVAGSLDRNRRFQRDRLFGLYRDSHLLILPTRADCTPMVVAEAMAFATPAIATRTGGMASLIAPGTGVLMERSDRAGDWAGEIASLAQDRSRLAFMADAAFDRAGTRLTWEAWARDIADLARQAMHPGRMVQVAA